MEKTEIHVSEPEKRHAWFKSHMMVVVGVLAVLAIAVAIILVTSKEDKQQKAQVETKLSKSSQAFEKGNYDQALKELEGAADQATNDKQKAQVYTEMASAAASAGQVPQAILYYKQKHEIDPASAKADAYILGTLYERIDDRAKAIEQFEIAIEYLKSQPQAPIRDADLESLELRLKDLKAGQ